MPTTSSNVADEFTPDQPVPGGIQPARDGSAPAHDPHRTPPPAPVVTTATLLKPTPPSGTSIWITFQKEGIHHYPAAATDPALAEVSFLGYPHRHTFHFRVELAVTHDNRDVEFILLKRELEGLYAAGTLQCNHKSCEMLARDLSDYVAEKYPNREIIVTVSEDGENGATIRRSA